MRVFLTSAAFIALSIGAAIAHPNAAVPNNNGAALNELAQKSAMPIAELETLLASCDTDNATQLALNFCAWRNQIAAEQTLTQTVAKKEQLNPQCKVSIHAKVNAWKHGLEDACKKAAAKDYAGGSMEPMARAMCVEAEINKITKRVKRTKNWGCKETAKHSNKKAHLP